MAIIVECPECQKRLKVGDDSFGKRLRCPACQAVFVAPRTEDDSPEHDTPRPRRKSERDSAVQEMRPTWRSRQDLDDDDDEDRPRRPRRSRDDDEDRPLRSRRKRRKIDLDEDPAYSRGPLVFGILSCCLSCAPIVGIILGRMAMTKADAEMDQLPPSRRFDSARSSLRMARTLGIVGMCLSGVMFVIGLILRLATLGR